MLSLSSDAESTATDRARNLGRLCCLLQARSFLVRFSTAIGLGLAAMFLAWTAAYLFLPEGMLRGKTVAGALSEHTNDLSTFVLALTWNGAVAFVVDKPEIATIEPESFAYSQPEFDFWRHRRDHWRRL